MRRKTVAINWLIVLAVFIGLFACTPRNKQEADAATSEKPTQNPLPVKNNHLFVKGDSPYITIGDTLAASKTFKKKDISLDGPKIMDGLVKEDGGLREVYYRNGKKNGIFKSYYKINGKLETLGFYKENKAVGTWYYFDEDSQIMMIEEVGGVNTDKEVKRDDGVMIKPPYISYLKEYDPKSGLLKREGIALYYEEVLIDYFRYGKWKEY